MSIQGEMNANISDIQLWVLGETPQWYFCLMRQIVLSVVMRWVEQISQERFELESSNFTQISMLTSAISSHMTSLATLSTDEAFRLSPPNGGLLVKFKFQIYLFQLMFFSFICNIFQLRFSMVNLYNATSFRIYNSNKIYSHKTAQKVSHWI